MVAYIEFKAHEKESEGGTPTGKKKYNGIEDFIKFVEERDLSIIVTDIGDVYGVGGSIIAHLIEAKDKDVDKIEEKFQHKLHWPTLVSGHDPRIEARSIGRFLEHLFDTSLHETHLKKGRRKKEW